MELWYYTQNGKQMGPVTAAELKRLAAQGILKPTDFVWCEAMPAWMPARLAGDLFTANTAITVASALAGAAAVLPIEEESERPRRERRREFDRHEDWDDVPRLRRGSLARTGMGVGLKVSLILGAGFLGLVLVAIVAITALRAHRARAQAQIQLRQAMRQRPPRAFFNPPNAPAGVKTHPPVFRGPLDVGEAGITINENLTRTDARDAATRRSCKVFAINMTAGKTYTIRQNRTDDALDPLLRIEDSNFNEVAQDNDSGGELNALLVYRPAQTGVYRVIATAVRGTGPFSLQITEN